MAEKVGFFGHFSSSENATATRLLGVHPYNFLCTCRLARDNLSRSQIEKNVANALRRIFLEVEKTLFSRKRHVFEIKSGTTAIQLPEVVAFDLSRHFTSERLGPHR